MNLQAARSEHGLVYHVQTVSHTDDEHVVQAIDTVNFRQQLIDNRLVDTCATRARRSSLSADCIYLIEDDNMQVRFFSVLLLVLLGWLKELADFFLRTANVLVENLGTINHLRLSTIEGFGYLPGYQSLARAWWSVEQHALAVLDAIPLNCCGRVPP